MIHQTPALNPQPPTLTQALTESHAGGGRVFYQGARGFKDAVNHAPCTFKLLTQTLHHSKPETQNPKPSTLNPTPETLNLETLNSEPQTPNFESQTLNPQP